MQVGSLENVVRYFALSALAVVISFAALVYFGIVKLPPHEARKKAQSSPPLTAVVDNPGPQANPAPLHPLSNPLDPWSAGGDQPHGAGTFQTGSVADSASKSPTQTTPPPAAAPQTTPAPLQSVPNSFNSWTAGGDQPQGAGTFQTGSITTPAPGATPGNAAGGIRPSQ